MYRRSKPLIVCPEWLGRVLSTIPFPLRPDVRELLFHLERAFEVKLDAKQFPWSAVEVDKADFTAGELHEWVCAQLRHQGRFIPHSSWHRVQSMLAEQTGTPAERVRPNAYVQRDLHYFEGG